VLIPVKELIDYWKVSPKGVIHVGAHEAEESEQYDSANWGNVCWVEAQPDKVDLLRKKFANSKDVVIDAAVWSSPGVQLNLQVMTNSASTSLLNLGTHNEAHPDILFSHSIVVHTQVLEKIIPGDSIADYLCLDIQGAELEAIKGFGDRVNKMKWIYTEVNKEELYEGCCLVSDLDDYLGNRGFSRVATRWTEFGWGDALYLHSNCKSQISRVREALWHLKNFKYYVIRKIRISFRKAIVSLRPKP
jgi:FkbM family methyltransferase